MRADTIVGYVFAADCYCTRCILDAYRAHRRSEGAVIDTVQPPTRLYPDVEAVLDEYAAMRGIDRQDEWTFDSGDFPKVVFASDADDISNVCSECREHFLA